MRGRKREEGFEQREELECFFVPGAERGDTLGESARAWGRGLAVGDRCFQVVDEAPVAFEMRSEGLGEGVAKELTHAGLRDVEGTPVSRDVMQGDGAVFDEKTQPLAGGTLADAETGNDFFERQRSFGGEQKTEYFADGSGQAEGLGDLHEKEYKFALQLAQTDGIGGGRIGGGSGYGFVFQGLVTGAVGTIPYVHEFANNRN
jgi:hypothetical protein